MTGATLAIGGYTAFLTVVFVVRTNRSSWVRFASPADAVSGALVGAALLCTLGAPALVLQDRIEPWLASPSLVAAGTLVLAAGIALAAAAQHQLGDAWRPGINPDDRVALVTTGLYRYSRNPFYVGWMIADAGMSLLVPSAVSVLGTTLLVAAFEVVVRFVEEPALRAAHGPTFADYRAGTARFI